MKYLLISVLYLFGTVSLLAQQNIAINNDGSAPDPKAILDIKSNTKGVLFPRMLQSERNAITNPPLGLVVFQTDGVRGLYYNASAVPSLPTWYRMINTEGQYWSKTLSGDHLFSNNTGNVGIGTTTPEYLLDINGRGRLRHEGANTAGLWYNKINNTEGAFAGMKADTVWGLYNAGWKFNFDIENTRLGINASTPQYPLTFQSIVGDKISLYGGGGAANADHYGLGIQGSLMQLFTPTSSTDIAFGYGRSGAFTENMRIKGNGNVGINTSTPEALLTINSATTGLLHTNGVIKIATDMSGTDGAIGTNSNHGLRFRTNSTTKMYINPAGNVGLGTFTPNEKLHIVGNVIIGTAASTSAAGYILNVAGKAIAEEVRVQLQAAWPDYVFNKDYKLMSLPELESFINANNHLPGFKAAKVIEKDGADLGETQRMLLEKVEELTLHLISINKRVHDLEEENKSLRIKHNK